MRFRPVQLLRVVKTFLATLGKWLHSRVLSVHICERSTTSTHLPWTCAFSHGCQPCESKTSASRMIQSLKALIENADAVYEKIVHCQKADNHIAVIAAVFPTSVVRVS
ncbi:hypothetical protein J1605_021242 [Eschrichtius robustus]|uniref:Uncharacterized protein n=1 Tax=Eschrichtius robustus TaxID=9764 RepID=A0AB34HH38_ESCRO|nr:hypothetical protein J1605_021242 [Eschrichtius robustus]